MSASTIVRVQSSSKPRKMSAGMVKITPHIAGFRPDHWDAVTGLFADNLRRFESGQPLLNVVNKEAGY